MKKVNKQCLLDTPNTVRVSEFLTPAYLSFENKISVESVQMKSQQGKFDEFISPTKGYLRETCKSQIPFI